MTSVQKLSSFNTIFSRKNQSLIVCTVLSLVITNSPIGPEYLSFWQRNVGGLSLEHWINDALMAIFFLLIGLELERELYVGELSNFKNALLPIVAAIGGMVAPALIHFSINAGTPTQAGIGIPMATDIAFALGVLAMLGNRIPASLKVFVVAFAVIDDLGAIVVIAAFYTAQLSVWYLVGALAVWTLLFALNRLFRIMSLVPYLLGGALMWFLMLKSGIHATIAGVMLAFAIPFSAKDDDEESPSHKLEHLLHKPVAFIILPIFALANTGIAVEADWMRQLINANSVSSLRAWSLTPVRASLLSALPRCERNMPFAARLEVVAHDRRRDSWRNRFYDVYFHCQSRILRKSGGHKRLEDGDFIGFPDGGNARLSLAKSFRQAWGTQQCLESH